MTTGSIYDLGYRGYDGPRLGRRHAVATLVRHSIRSILGIGRSGRAKILPAFCLGLPALVALILVGDPGARRRRGRARRHRRSSPATTGCTRQVAVFPILFVAAQAPELLGRDQRYRVLTLYFSRALRRPDYALAKLVALSIGVLSILLLPQLILAVGTILLDHRHRRGDPDRGWARCRRSSARRSSSPIVTAAFALVIASLTPRRAYATAAIFGAFIIPGDRRRDRHRPRRRRGRRSGSSCIDVGSLLDGVNAWFFGVAPTGRRCESDVPVEALAGGAVLLGGRLRRSPSSGATSGSRHDRQDAPLVGPDRRRRRASGAPARPDRRRSSSRTSRAGTATSSRSTTSRSPSGPGSPGLLGPNGAGKSTLLHMISGLLRPSAGQVVIGGQPAWRDPEVYRRIGLVPEREAVYPFLTGPRVRAPQRPAPGAARPRGGRRPGDRDGRADRRRRTARSGPTRRACASGRRSPARSSTSRRSCCSTSRSTGWTRASGSR